MSSTAEFSEAPELSPEDYAEHTANMTAEAFQKTGLIEFVEIKGSLNQISLLGRVKENKVQAFSEKVIKPVLRIMQKTCDGFIGTQYLIRGDAPNDELYYGWVVAFGSPNIREAATAICEALAPAIPRQEVMSVPLLGPSAPQGSTVATGGGRKGATPVR